MGLAAPKGGRKEDYMSETKYDFDLQMFAEASGGEASAMTSQGENSTVSAQQSGTEGGVSSHADRQKAYDAFIKEHKDLDDARVQGLIKDRVKNIKAKAELADSLSSVADIFYERYGVTKGDVEGLAKAANDDLTNFEAEAARRGMDADTWRTFRDKELKLEAYETEKKETERKKAEQEQIDVWMKEAEALKEEYPDFDLEAELGNEEFAALFGTGKVSMKKAYLTAHFDEMMSNAMAYSAKQGEAMAISRVKNSARPLESGVAGNSPSVSSKLDAKTLTKEERQKIAQEVMEGKRYSFG